MIQVYSSHYLQAYVYIVRKKEAEKFKTLEGIEGKGLLTNPSTDLDSLFKSSDKRITVFNKTNGLFFEDKPDVT